jgi:hypothetical protein
MVILVGTPITMTILTSTITLPMTTLARGIIVTTTCAPPSFT